LAFFDLLNVTSIVLELPMSLFRRRFILIADDNQDLAISLSILLKLVGFDVQAVHDGRDAVTVAKTRKPDVLLLDIGLPGLNGYQVAGQFRSDERLKDTIIIAISGYSRNMFERLSKPGDFDHYLVKPVDFRTLLPLINKTA
jgi:CheY-like chemotaxis protein